MKWEGERQSDNVEDRRDAGPSGGGGFPIGGRGIGLGTIVIALVGGWILGINPLTLLSALSGGGMPDSAVVQQAPAQRPPADDRMASFVSTVLADTEDVWKQQFSQMGGSYRDPKLVLFRGATPTACGTGQTAMGPFYCPGDQKVYIDLAFYDTLRSQLGAPGDFAQAYVIAHEVGHHVQNLMGITDKVDQARQRMSEAQANALSVRLELQADCFAGVWGYHAQQMRQILEQGDIEEALNAAGRIGDDVLQRQSTGTVRPESFTHGSSAQRVNWFKRGMQSGDLKQCNTFETRQL
ncbi:MAG TPA: neutral zinc metallopeptidase [Piscinibacter sp.]|uniref:KPN_02809 family neutral zinc metallopeptidase n=1 Tax=Piscinibacter sp. TaxID=1903157 RepID=UPI002BF7F9C0|nr:neutral zinc metallopeptidase [Burkholderiaceae bacterium]HNI86485.1 neutral zinc metallopeptidase [Ottowia sp.]HNK19767.1 neutral zinc metallopeptidase [Piscinibacter sp.]HNL43076.1 neutral zinc metallopeptidase [Ottowia sp.]